MFENILASAAVWGQEGETKRLNEDLGDCLLAKRNIKKKNGKSIILLGIKQPYALIRQTYIQNIKCGATRSELFPLTKFLSLLLNGQSVCYKFVIYQ